MFRKSLVALVVAGFLTDGALAGTSATVTPIPGSVGSPFSKGQVHGYTYNFEGAPAGAGPPFNLYDNIPTIFGGTGTPGLFGPFDSILGSYFFIDWISPDAQWGDDMHRIANAGQPSPVMTKLWYSYFNRGGTPTTPGVFLTVTDIIKLYQMVPPSVVPPVTAPDYKGGTRRQHRCTKPADLHDVGVHGADPRGYDPPRDLGPLVEVRGGGTGGSVHLLVDRRCARDRLQPARCDVHPQGLLPGWLTV